MNILNTKTGTILPVVSMNKVSTPSDEYSDGNFVNGEAYTAPGSLYDTGDYEYYFVAYDKDGKSIRFPEEDNLNFAVIPSTYKYLPKYSFGTNNGDGNNWQAWFFNGSIIYDWTDVYSHNYLREQFKIKTGGFGSYCSNCLERGLFSHDPQKGFEISDVNSSALEMNPQNNQNNTVYDVSIQWDASGYVYTISHGGVVDSTGHTNITNMSNDLWVGWDSSQNNFKNFPYGSWAGIPAISPDGRGGGVDMIMTPYPIYDPNAVQTPDPVVKSSEKEILSFDFYSLDPKVVGIIDNTDHTISLTVPYDTDITNLSPTIVVSDKAVITPASMSVGDFTNPVTYIVKAEDDSDTSYVVSVLVAPDPNPKPPVEETGDPNIKSYSLNDDTGNITINPLVKNLTIVLNANKKVNWMSVKIEKESDPKIYKMFLAGSSCVNGTNICTKVWTGILSSGGLLQSGNYKIKVHIKDADGREYEQYLPSVIMVNL